MKLRMRSVVGAPAVEALQANIQTVWVILQGGVSLRLVDHWIIIELTMESKHCVQSSL